MDGESAGSTNELGSVKDKQGYDLDSSVFQCDENSNTEEKGKGTHLWASPLIHPRGSPSELPLHELWVHSLQFIFK